MNINKMSLIEAISLILIVTITRLAINIPQEILISCGSASILNIAYLSLIVIIFTYIIVKLFKKFPTSDIIDVSEFLGSKFFKYFIGISLFTYITIISAILLRDFVEIIHILYYTDTPIVYLLAFFIIVSMIANLLGKNSIIKTNLILCIIITISLLVTFSSVTPNLTIQRALPILGYGTYNTFFLGLANIFAYNGVLVLYLIPPMLQEKKDFGKASILAIIITAILMILATTSILLAFSFSTNIEKISPLYTLLSNNEFGKYFQHPESLFVFTWILSFMSFLSITFMLLSQILKKLTNVKNSKPFAVPISLLFLIISIIPKNIIQVRDFGTDFSKYVGIPITFIFLPIVLILANLKHKKYKKDSLTKENSSQYS